VSLTIVKAGQDFYVQINGGEIVKETYAAFEGEATPGLFTMNYSGTWSDYSYTVGETAVNNWLKENDTGDSSDTTGKVKIGWMKTIRKTPPIRRERSRR